MGSFVSWFERSYKAIIVVLVGIMALMLVILAVQHVNASKPAEGAVAGPVPTFSSTAGANVRFAVVGDSVTAANSPDIDNGRAGDASWTYYAGEDGAHLVGGWAQPGATTDQMVAGVQSYSADVLVIIAGTNDTGQNVPFDHTASNLKAIVSKAGVPKVIVSSIPPRDADPSKPETYNAKLHDLATQQGWTFVDGNAALQDGGKYKDGFTADGIHPTVAGAKALGRALHTAILSAS